MKRVLVAGYLVLCVLLPSVVLAEENKDKTLTGSITLGQAFQMALLKNPDLQAFSYEVRAREAKTLQSGMTYNPKLYVQVENVAGTGNFNGVSQSETTVQLSQRLELGNKRNLRKSSANLSKEIAGWDYKVQRLEVLTRVSKSFIHVLKAQQKIALTDEGMQLAKKFLNAVSERMKAGKVPAIETIKAKVALANMGIEEKQARQELENARRNLSVLWGEAEPFYDSVHGDLFSVPEQTPEAPKSLLSNPRLSKWSTALAQRQAELDVENSKAIPDLTLSGSYRRLEQSDDNTLVFGMTVPLNWFNRNQGGIAEARHRLSKAEEEKRAEELRIQKALLMAHGKVSLSHAKVISIKTEVLPGAREALEAISEGYRFGKFDLLDVLDSQKTFYQVQSQYLDALANYHTAVADVNRLLGVDPLVQNKEKGANRP